MKFETLMLAAILSCAAALPGRAAQPKAGTDPDARGAAEPAAPEKNPDPNDPKSVADAQAVDRELPELDKQIAGLNAQIEDVASCNKFEDSLQADVDSSGKRYAAEFKGGIPREFQEILARKRMRKTRARQLCGEKYKQAGVKFDDTLNAINAVNTQHPGSAKLKARLEKFQKVRKTFTAMERKGSETASQ